jgi:hypothetical protein
MKTKQKLNSIVLAGLVLVLFLIFLSSTVSAKGYIPDPPKSGDAAKLEDMQDRVQKLVDHGTLAESTGNTWNTLLETAETAILDNNAAKARSSLNNFIKTATPYLKKDKLSQGSKDKIKKLIDDANNIIWSLQPY